MRCGRKLQRLHQAQKRLILHFRHFGYWQWRNCRYPDHQQIQYVLSHKENIGIRISPRVSTIWVEDSGNRMV